MIHRDEEFCILRGMSVITAWSLSAKSSSWNDVSPRNSALGSASQGVSHHSFGTRSRLVQTSSVAMPGREVHSPNKTDVFESVYLYPSGTMCGEHIRAMDVISRARCAVAVLTSGHRLVVFTSSSYSEHSPLAERVFHVQSVFRLSMLKAPNSVLFSPAHGHGESVFITDSETDRVAELRFESSSLTDPRTCPDVSVLYWYLESGIPVGSGCRVSMKRGKDDRVFLIVVGLESNGESQGVVTLLSARDSSFAVSSSEESVTESVQWIGNALMVNSRRSFRVVVESQLDFPSFIRGPVHLVKAVLIGEMTIVLVLVDKTVRSYLADVNGGLTALPWRPLTDIDSFEIGQYHHLENTFCVWTVREAVAQILAVDVQSGECIVVDADITIQGSLVSAAIAEPIIKADGEHMHAFINSDGRVCGMVQAQMVLDSSIKYIDCSISEQFFALLSADSRVYIHSRFSEPVYTVDLPRPVTISSKLQIIRRLGADIVVASPFLIRKSIDPYRGFVWTVIDSGLSGQLTLSENSIIALAADSGQVIMHPIPAALIPSTDAFEDVASAFRVYQECMNPSHSHPVDLSTLPEGQRVALLPLVSVTEDSDRATDLPSRKFLIAWHFSRSSPDQFSLTSEHIAWAGLSDTTSVIVDTILQTPVTWTQVRASGVAYWCDEPIRLRELAEGIQKSALQEYMKGKDATILDLHASVWLAALGKKQLMASLYKQHGSSCASPVHTKVAQFLSTNFGDPENAAKGVKNAFELVRQKRYAMAASVFLLAGSVQEAIDVCCRQMKDVQLGLMILKVLSTRVGCDPAPITAMIDQLWTTRIVDPMVASGDVFFKLLHCWLRKDIDDALPVLDTMGKFTQMTDDSETGPFRIQELHVSRIAVHEYLTVFAAKLKRLNRHVPSSLPQLSDSEIAGIYVELGCPHLAERMHTFPTFTPALQWAIQNGS